MAPKYRNFIDGKWVESVSKQRVTSISPVNKKKIIDLSIGKLRKAWTTGFVNALK